jgi:hypothetical protein
VNWIIESHHWLQSIWLFLEGNFTERLDSELGAMAVTAPSMEAVAAESC